MRPNGHNATRDAFVVTAIFLVLVISLGLVIGIIAYQKTSVLILDGHGDHSRTKPPSPPPPIYSSNSSTNSISSSQIANVSSASTQTSSTVSTAASPNPAGEEAGAGIATLVAGLVLFFIGRRDECRNSKQAFGSRALDERQS